MNQSNFTIPNHVSLEARNLIQNLIVKDPRKRLSLEQIQRHPFLRRQQPKPSSPTNSVINTNRLKPIKQRIRHGTIEIDWEGNVIFEHGEDGTRVDVRKGGVKVVVRYDAKQQEIFQYPDLPGPVAKRYELMRKFVHLIQSKTPKVILYTDALKAYLMESYDLFIYYENNVKAEYVCANQMLRIIVDGRVEREILEPSMEQLQPDASNTERMCLVDFCTRYHQCLQVAHGLEQQGSPPSVYPFIIKEAFNNNAALINRRELRPSEASQRSQSVIVAQTQKGDDERRFIYGVGWCLCVSKEHYVMLFDDGSSLQVNGPQNSLLYSSRPEAPVERYSLEHSALPQHIRLKLVHFPRFMALWEEQHQPARSNQNRFRSTLTFGTSLMKE